MGLLGGQNGKVEYDPDATTNVPAVTTDTPHPVQASTGHQQATQPNAQQTGQDTEQGNAITISPTTTTGMHPRSTSSTLDPAPSPTVHQQAAPAATQQAGQVVATGNTAHQAAAGQIPPTSASTQQAGGAPPTSNTAGVQPASTLNPAAPPFIPAGPVQAGPGGTQQAAGLARGRGTSRLADWVHSHRGRTTSRFFGGGGS